MNRRTPRSSSARISSPMPCVARAPTGTLIAIGIGDADDLGGFDDRGPAFGSLDDSVRGGARSPARAGNLHDEPIAAARHHGVERSFAAVGHRTRANLGRGPYAHEAARDRRRHRARVERAFERVWSDHDDRRSAGWPWRMIGGNAGASLHRISPRLRWSCDCVRRRCSRLMLVACTQARAADYAREERWAQEIAPAIVVGDAVYLSTPSRPRVFAILTQPPGTPKGGAVIVHGLGVHPDWGLNGGIRTRLAEAGFVTLSVQMPVLAAGATRDDYRATLPEAGERIAAAIALPARQGRRENRDRLAQLRRDDGERVSRAARRGCRSTRGCRSACSVRSTRRRRSPCSTSSPSAISTRCALQRSSAPAIRRQRCMLAADRRSPTPITTSTIGRTSSRRRSRHSSSAHSARVASPGRRPRRAWRASSRSRTASHSSPGGTASMRIASAFASSSARRFA